MLDPEMSRVISSFNPIGKIERWMLFYGKNEYKLVGKLFPDDIPAQLKLEGFFESDEGIRLEFQKWEEKVQIDPKSITVLTHGKEHINTYLGFDVIPPNVVYSDIPELPRISIITPIYNSEKFFESYVKELESMRYPRDLLEVVLIDDGSSDRNSVKDFSTKVKDVIPNTLLIGNRENMGVFYSKMVGANVASGTYITFWDIDDKYDPYQLFLLSIHNTLLHENSEDFLVTAPSILISPDGKVLDIWKTRYGDPIHLVVESMLAFSGRIVIASNLLSRESVVKAYNTLQENYEVLKVIPRLSVPEDTILANQMVLEGFIKTIYPVSYTGRGHVRYLGNTSANLQRRVREIPLASVLTLINLREHVGLRKVEELLNKNSEIISRSVTLYGKFSRDFVKYLLEYLEVYGERNLKEMFLRMFKKSREIL